MGRKRRGRVVAGTAVDSHKRFRVDSNKLPPPKTDYDYVTKHDYMTIDNFHYVRPYVFEFKCNFKLRWLNRTILDVFVDEFRHTGRDYWLREFHGGRVRANGSAIDEETLWSDGIEVVHVVHRHESAVLASPIGIAVDHEGFIVVSKPPSMPVHPCGTYRRNSLQFLLRSFHGYGPLLSVHRLDKETSGLVILAKTSEYAARFASEIKQHKFVKTYVAEVDGIFPLKVIECSRPVLWDKREMRSSIVDVGLDAKTAFKVIATDAQRNTSIVECKPVTGRTHQIRVHLAHVGYPILNDSLYGKACHVHSGSTPTAPTDLTAVTLDDSRLQRNDRLGDDVRPSNSVCEWVQKTRRQVGHILSTEEEGARLSCSNCPQVTNVKNVGEAAMIIHLHALKYESDDWKFEVSPPPWMYTQSTTQRMACSIA